MQRLFYSMISHSKSTFENFQPRIQGSLFIVRLHISAVELGLTLTFISNGIFSSHGLSMSYFLFFRCHG